MPNVGDERVSGGVNQIYTNDGVLTPQQHWTFSDRFW